MGKLFLEENPLLTNFLHSVREKIAWISLAKFMFLKNIELTDVDFWYFKTELRYEQLIKYQSLY